MEALQQSGSGKGRERHASGEPWHEQPIIEIQRWLGTPDFALGQALKKIHESKRLPTASARKAERLGAIVYLAASIYFEEIQHAES